MEAGYIIVVVVVGAIIHRRHSALAELLHLLCELVTLHIILVLRTDAALAYHLALLRRLLGILRVLAIIHLSALSSLL